jgi:hypothetical protein
MGGSKRNGCRSSRETGLSLQKTEYNDTPHQAHKSNRKRRKNYLLPSGFDKVAGSGIDQVSEKT